VRALGLQRVALATPYHDALNAHEQHFLEDNGIAVLGMRGLGIGAGGAAEYIRIAQVPLQQVYDHVMAADMPGAQAILVSCTDFASLPLLSGLEQALGKPLKPLAMAALTRFRAETGGALPLIAVGGIASGQDAYDRIRAGASAVQLYSALVYHGPGLVGRIKAELAALLRRDGFASVGAAVGAPQV
jgi:dihydroorotate dehydrogenase